MFSPSTFCLCGVLKCRSDTYIHIHARDRGAYLIAAILVCWEYRLLGQDLRIANLRWAFGIKLFFIIAEIALVAAFQAYRFQKAYNTSAYFEWIVALVNISFVASFAFDFLPVTPVKRASQNYPMM